MTSTREGSQVTMQGAFTSDKIAEKQGNGNKPALKPPASIFIQIDEQYAIGADTHSWHILERHRYKGGYRWEPIAWYGTPEQCSNALVDRAVRTCGAQSLAEALAESRRITSALCAALRPSFKVEGRRDG